LHDGIKTQEFTRGLGGPALLLEDEVGVAGGRLFNGVVELQDAGTTLTSCPTPMDTTASLSSAMLGRT